MFSRPNKSRSLYVRTFRYLEEFQTLSGKRARIAQSALNSEVKRGQQFELLVNNWQLSFSFHLGLKFRIS